MSVDCDVGPQFLRCFHNAPCAAVYAVPMSMRQKNPVAADIKAEFVFQRIGPVHIAGDRIDFILALFAQDLLQIPLHVARMDQHVDRSLLSDGPAKEIMISVRIAYDQYFHVSPYKMYRSKVGRERPSHKPFNLNIFTLYIDI